jgi:outer membrane receptor protein involved in Fe transport
MYNLNQLDNFNFSSDVYAAYTSVTFPLLDVYSFKLGVRDEYTKTIIPTDTVNLAPTYNSFIPSIVISRKLNNNQTIKITYYRRLQRAGYRELNPFVDATDPTSLIRGNPYLKPERTNAGELSYFKFFNNGSSILGTLYYRNTQDDEQSYILSADTFYIGKTQYRNVIINTNENAGTQQLTGLNLSGTLVLSQKFELRGNAILFNKYIVSNLVPGTTYSSFNYRINGNATYQFSKTLVAEFFYSFNSPRTEIQGKFPSVSSYSFAIRQLLFKQKASIGFTTNDPFNKYTNQTTNVSGTGFSVVSERRVPYQSFGLSFTYKFGKMEYKEKKQEHNDVNNGDEGN